MSKELPILEERRAEQVLNTAIDNFISKMRLLARRYPNEGVGGSTTVDEAIVAEIYGRLHGGLD